MDPLQVPLALWTDQDARSLRGRDESERFEVKSYKLNLNLPEGRRKAAESVAAMASASGGYIVFGTSDDKDTFKAFHGHGATSLDAFGRALRDHVRPPPAVEGPREFEDEGGRKIAAVQVLADPLARPFSVEGRFWIRTGSSNVTMHPDEVARRFAIAGASGERAFEAARRHATSGSWAAKSWMRFGITPYVGVDLGHSGRQLLKAVMEPAVKLESEAAAAHLGHGDLFMVPGGFSAWSRGVRYVTIAGNPNAGAGLDLYVSHSGAMHGRIDLGLHAGAGLGAPSVDLKALESVVLRILGTATAISRLGGLPVLMATALHAEIQGPLGVEGVDAKGNRFPRSLGLSPQDADIDLTLGPWGPPGPLYDGARLFAQRVYENSSDNPPDLIAPWPGHEQYAAALCERLSP